MLIAEKLSDKKLGDEKLIAEHLVAEHPTPASQEPTMTVFEQQVTAAADWFANPRFDGIVRLYSPRQVAEQQGTLAGDYTVARQAAEAFYARLRVLFEQRKQITTFGPYSPGQAVMMKRIGMEGIYLGGWATSAKGLSLIHI